MSFTEYNHENADRAIHDILYDLVPNGVDNIRLMCEKFDPNEMTWGDLQESDPEAYQPYNELVDKILDRLEDHDIIPNSREVAITEEHFEWSDEFWDLLDDQIENFVYGYRSTHELAS